MFKKTLFTTLILALLLFLLIPLTTMAQDQDMKSAVYYDILSEYVGLYNDNLDEIPGVIKRIFAKERIIVYIARDSEDEAIGVATSKDTEIIEFVQGELTEPTMLVYINGDTIDSLIANPSQGAAVEALNELKIEGVGFFKKIKVAFLNILISVSGWFL